MDHSLMHSSCPAIDAGRCVCCLRLQLSDAGAIVAMQRKEHMSFESLGLSPSLLSAIAQTGFTEPTPVQQQAIPQAIAGHDLMVSSQTGSGKTAAFML